MSKFKDLTGMKFGRLTAIRVDEEMSKKFGRTCWLCKCACGNTISVRALSLTRGDTKSCGCYNKEVAAKNCIKRSTTHGFTNTRLYRIWNDMKVRCYNTKAKDYNRYGGRGITICEEWVKDFLNFYNWAIANGYSDDLTIDRIDVNGNYEPSNCRWVTLKVQGNNRRDNIYITINGDTKTLTEWYEMYKPDVGYTGIYWRYSKEGFQSVEQLFRDKAS